MEVADSLEKAKDLPVVEEIVSIGLGGFPQF